MIRAVVFDLDGVLIDSEQLWDQARREVAARHGGRWRADATAAMQGMSSTEWKVLAIAGLRDAFQATVSSEEVPRGKPAPDVYLEAARRLGRLPGSCAAIEDSANGIRSAVAAGLHVVAVPNRDYPPPDSVLASAEFVAQSLSDLTADLFTQLGGT